VGEGVLALVLESLEGRNRGAQVLLDGLTDFVLNGVTNDGKNETAQDRRSGQEGEQNLGAKTRLRQGTLPTWI
jgi:hypothetical protein